MLTTEFMDKIKRNIDSSITSEIDRTHMEYSIGIFFSYDPIGLISHEGVVIHIKDHMGNTKRSIAIEKRGEIYRLSGKVKKNNEIVEIWCKSTNKGFTPIEQIEILKVAQEINRK